MIKKLLLPTYFLLLTSLYAHPICNKAISEIINRSITRTEKAHIKAYSKVDYMIINEYLRFGLSFVKKEYPKKIREKATSRIPYIKFALKKLPNYEGVVFRNVALEKEIIENILESGIYQDKAFVSTSRTKNPRFAGNVRMTILSKTGKNIEQFTAADESEVLFLPKTKFKLTDYKIENGLHYLELEEF